LMALTRRAELHSPQLRAGLAGEPPRLPNRDE